MNPEKEFVKSIMSVLRLEQNIYTVASIEEIIDRINTKDYTIFIAYLGERKSDFEKPIQSIAIAVDEFHRKTITPMALALDDKYSTFKKEVTSVIVELTKEKMTDQEKEQIVANAKTRKKQSHDTVLPYPETENKWAIQQSKIIDNMEDMPISDYKDSFIKYGSENLYTFIEDYNILPYDIFHEKIGRNYFFDFIYKPSISQKIDTNAIASASDETAIENKEVLKLVERLEYEKNIVLL